MLINEITEEDGRLSYPEIVQYEILEGPHKGVLLNCPPSVKKETWIDPDAHKRRHFSMSQERPATYPYRLVVLDRETFNTPEFQLLIRSPLHLGGENSVDNRAAPGK